jgi:ABC-2 type transport system ATP-binding protein
MDVAVDIQALSKTFHPPRGLARLRRQRPTTAVEDVTLQVLPGELFGLLGPNGAGKTTLIKMLCTLIVPSGGSATVAGYPLGDVLAIRSVVGLVVTDERSFYWRLTARRNLHFFAALHGLRGEAARRRVDAVLDAVDLLSEADRWFSDFSTGMKQRLAIARGLLHEPQILFLDEPTRSLDPVSTQRLHSLIARLQQERALTVFLITHDLAEAEKLCTRVALMHHGCIQVVGAPAGLRSALNPRRHYSLTLDALPASLVTALQQIDPLLEADSAAATLRFLAAERSRELQRILDLVHASQATIQTIDGAAPSLEQVFAHYTGDEAH